MSCRRSMSLRLDAFQQSIEHLTLLERDLSVRRVGRGPIRVQTRVVDRSRRGFVTASGRTSAPKRRRQCSLTSGCIQRRKSGDNARQISAEMTAMIAI